MQLRQFVQKVLPNSIKDEVNVSTEGVKTQKIGNEVIDGSLEWTLFATNTNTYNFRIVGWAIGKNVYHPNTDVINAIANSNDGSYIVSSNQALDQRQICVYSNDNLYAAVEKLKVDAQIGVTTLDKFKLYLNAYPITLTYQLAIPKTYMSKYLQ